MSAIDALIAFSIFAVTFSLFVNFEQQASQSGNGGFEQVFPLAQRVAYQLSGTPGNPANWNQSNFNQLGLSDRPGVIDPVKLTSLSASNYALIEQSLGVSRYNLNVQLLNVSNPAVPIMQLPAPQAVNPTTFVPVFVPVVYNGSAELLEVTLWQ